MAYHFQYKKKTKQKKKNTLNYPKSSAVGFSKGHKNEFEASVADKPSVFEPLKFYCSYVYICSIYTMVKRTDF